MELLPLLATDENNHLKNYLNGKTKITLVGASNTTLEELRDECLHPDFYDRIAQLILQVPPLADAPEDREADWKAIWKQLQFTETCPQSPELLRWLKQLELPGNFRDLQRIAMSYRAWDTFPPELKRLYQGIQSALAFAQQEYKKQQSPDKQPTAYPFDRNTPLQQMKRDFHQALATWAHATFSSDQKAVDHFQALDPAEKVNRVSINNWRLGKYGSQKE